MLRHVPLVACLSLISLLPRHVNATAYNFALEFAGEKFFDDWEFLGALDNLSNSNSNFLDSSDAAKKRLAFVNDAGNAVIRVDNSSEIKFGDARDSVRVHTKDRWAVGSVWIADMLHVPYGCSVWPAFWSVAPNWPSGGEIDTFEGVNMVTRNQMALHTTAGCTQQNPTQSSTLVNATNCDVNANFNEGCVVTDPRTTSYGADFAAAGGGIFVTEFAETGISVWFFERANIPAALQGNVSTFDTASLGLPVSNWPSTGCNIDRFFEPQSLVFNIALCGDFAGMPAVFLQTCSGDCYHSYVLGPPSYYDTAYFEIQHVRIYNDGRDTRVPGSAASLLGSAGAGWRLAAQVGATVFGALVLQSLLEL